MLLSRNERLELRATKAFSDTNNAWNDLQLNSTDNIGAVMAIIKNSKATTFDEWESFYLNTGDKRKRALATTSDLHKLNRFNGRTKDDLLNVAKILAKECNLDISVAFNYVYIRVIDETWIGYSRELKVLDEIRTMCAHYNLRADGVDSYMDTQYAVDFEIRDQDKVVLAVQLKSTNYKYSQLSAVKQIRKVNLDKNKRYTNRYGADVLYLYINSNDRVVNMNELEMFLSNSYKAMK